MFSIIAALRNVYKNPHRGRKKCPLCRKEMTHIQPCRLEGAEYSTNDWIDVNSIQPRSETPILEHPEFHIHEDDDFSEDNDEDEDDDEDDDNDNDADENDPLCKSLAQPPLQAFLHTFPVSNSVNLLGHGGRINGQPFAAEQAVLVATARLAGPNHVAVSRTDSSVCSQPGTTPATANRTIRSRLRY
ncbi:hypothetical protein BP6252_00987 [Coleophoma cylindrospora]|uniref:Uncharacterized protein n=1 Tax=Coleophoma cylindrospora TaxID=1849047 RepID=A0A3D8SRM6_9HELO|nr:hypothetical protein BP6252_00987 [Coleophoma cylindrospora]